MREQRTNVRRQHLRRVDVRCGKQTCLERLEIYFLDAGDGGDEDACKTERGRVVHNACRDDQDAESNENNGGVALPGAGSAEGRTGRQASNSGRLVMQNLGMNKMTGWAPFYNVHIAVEH
jgi:hypothetical protein